MIAFAKPKSLRVGDKVRFISPASPAERDKVEKSVQLLESWGFKVDFGAHVFDNFGHFAGSDEHRLSDLNDAIRDPNVRAIVATRGGVGSYRLVDGIDFSAARQDVKFLVGFSDVSILHLAMLKHGIGGALHGALRAEDRDTSGQRPSIYALLTDTAALMTLQSSPEEKTAVLTTTGRAEGFLLGGDVDMIATAAGWALPKLAGSVLLLEGGSRWVLELDRMLTMLRRAGHLDGIVGVAVGYAEFENMDMIVDILLEHLSHFTVPILGGLPVGHGKDPWTVPLGRRVVLDADAKTLTIANT